ncbi:MAG: DUF1501 domain-containing protein [Pseudomonadota bacterium]
MANISRRHVLAGMGTAGFATSLGTLKNLGMSNAWAAETSGYKAMVCIFLKGGMDAADTIIPYDQSSYDQLKSVRPNLFDTYNSDRSESSRNRENLLRLTPSNSGDFGGREFGVSTQLAPIHNMFETGDLAVIGNIGPLIEPTARTQLENGTAILPPRLFSHNDQQATWMSFGVEGVNRGWGGRFMDTISASAPNQNPVFSAISVTSNDVFLAGEQVNAFRISFGNVAEPSLINRQLYLGYTSGDDAARSKMEAFLEKRDFQNRSIIQSDIANATSNAFLNTEQFVDAKQNAIPLTTQFPDTALGGQLKSVAETMQIRHHLNVSRQMFYCAMEGFDTHSDQTNKLPELHEELAGAMGAFRQAMLELGVWDNVVVFTASDFGRTLIDNGNGTDHGWGGHQFVAGGSVQGRRIYGEIPSPEPGSSSYTQSRGRLLPTTSVDQYAATLGGWFGLDSAELRATLPNINNFETADLGFMSSSGS